MNCNEEALTRLTMKQNPNLTRTEAAKFARELRQKFLDVEDLVSREQVEDMRVVVSRVDELIGQLRDIMNDKEVCRLFSAVTGGFGFLGLLGAANPIGAVAFTVSILTSIGFGIGASCKSDVIHQKLRQIEDIISIDRKNFRLVAQKIRSLDEQVQKYLKYSIFKEENQRFLRSAAKYLLTKKGCSQGNAGDRIIELLRSLAIAESLSLLYSVITGCAVLGSVSAMFPLFGAGMQTLLLIKDINDNDEAISKLHTDVAAMKKKLEVLDILY